MDLFPQPHQIGGAPLIFNEEPVFCPLCARPSPLLAVICDDASGNPPSPFPPANSFVGNMGVQMVFHFWRDCSVVSAYHSND
jgi:hypothetical protein